MLTGTCTYMYIQGCVNSELTAGHFDWPIISTLVLLSIYFVYSSVSIYQTFTRFIGQCPAWLAVFIHVPLHIYTRYMIHIVCMCVTMYIFMYNTNVYMYEFVCVWYNLDFWFHLWKWCRNFIKNTLFHLPVQQKLKVCF